MRVAAAPATVAMGMATSGGTPCSHNNEVLLKDMGLMVYVKVNSDVLLEWILKKGIPAFFPHPDDPKKSLNILLKE